jgi:hypothetical protein
MRRSRDPVPWTAAAVVVALVVAAGWMADSVLAARAAARQPVVQNRVSGVSAAEGTVGFQLEGTPFELRRVSMTPLER